MFRSLLVPLDGSSQAATALQPARAVAEATGGAITLLRVPGSHSESDCQKASSYLASVAQELHAANTPVDIVVRPGEPAQEILALARARHCDLIVMATNAPGPRSMTILTSVGRWVLANSPAP